MSWFYWIYLGLLLGLLPHQSASLSPKPIVLLSFMPLANSSSETHAQGLGWLKEFVSGNKSLWTQLGKHSQLFPNAEAIHQTLNKKRAERPSRFQELRDRVRFFNAEDSKDVERCLEKLKAPSATKIYVIAAERVANPIFWRFFAAAELPCIFEGEGTAAPLCNLGKPFLHLYSQEWAGENSEGVDQLYPDPQLQPVIKNRRGGSELSQLREVCSQVVWSLTPERGYEEDSEGELCVEKRVFGFLQEVTTSGTHLNQYFRALRNTFHDQAEDKVLDGLLRWLRWGEETKKFT